MISSISSNLIYIQFVQTYNTIYIIDIDIIIFVSATGLTCTAFWLLKAVGSVLWWRYVKAEIQGYLAHKKHPSSPGPPYSPRHSPTVLAGGRFLISEVPLYVQITWLR